MIEEFNIYYSDLKEDAQKRLLERFDTTPEAENWDKDIIPITTITREG